MSSSRMISTDIISLSDSDSCSQNAFTFRLGHLLERSIFFWGGGDVFVVNAYVANGGWVPRGLGAGTANTNPGGTPHKPALPATQPQP